MDEWHAVGRWSGTSPKGQLSFARLRPGTQSLDFLVFLYLGRRAACNQEDADDDNAEDPAS